MFDEWDLEEIRSTEDREERMNLIFEGRPRVEAITDPEDIEAVSSVKTPDGSEKSKQRVVEEAEEIELKEGQAVVIHETNLGPAKDIMAEGFDDPFNHFAEDSYHIPSSIRYGCVFTWPHIYALGSHDKGGVTILCRADIDDILVASYESFDALEEREWYEDVRPEVQYSAVMFSEEYNKYHVFEYRDHIQWLERGGTELSSESLLPYRLS